MKGIVYEQKNWTYQIYLEDDRPQQVLWENGFKSHLLSTKKNKTKN